MALYSGIYCRLLDDGNEGKILQHGEELERILKMIWSYLPEQEYLQIKCYMIKEGLK